MIVGEMDGGVLTQGSRSLFVDCFWTALENCEYRD